MASVLTMMHVGVLVRVQANCAIMLKVLTELVGGVGGGGVGLEMLKALRSMVGAL